MRYVFVILSTFGVLPLSNAGSFGSGRNVVVRSSSRHSSMDIKAGGAMHRLAPSNDGDTGSHSSTTNQNNIPMADRLNSQESWGTQPTTTKLPVNASDADNNTLNYSAPLNNTLQSANKTEVVEPKKEKGGNKGTEATE